MELEQHSYSQFYVGSDRSLEGDRGEIDHYIGLARMFRALVYYSKVKDYSDVPWYSHDLQNDGH